MASSIFSAVKADEMTGATSSSPGVSGLVPAPAAGDEDKVLKGDGSWGDALDGMLRIVPFSIGVSSWALSNGVYTSNFVSEFITTTSVEFVEYTDSFRNSVRGDLSWTKTPGGGGITFRTGIAPSGTLEGEIRVFDRDDGKTAIVVQQTALPTMRNVPFTVAVADWSLNDSLYEAVFETAYVTATSHDFVEFDESIENATDGIKVIKAEYEGEVIGLKFVSRRVPAGAVSGTVTPLDNADGKVAVALQDTVMPIANGGTGANTLAGAQDALGITSLENRVDTLLDYDLIFSDSVDSTSATVKSLISGKKFSDYKYLVFTVSNSNDWIRASEFVVGALFTRSTNYGILLLYGISSTAFTRAFVYYNTDTSIRLNCESQPELYSLYIYGIK